MCMWEVRINEEERRVREWRRRRTAEMSSNMGECQRSDAVLICKRCMSEWPSSGQVNDYYRVDELDTREIHVVL